jgi:hydroxymethylpyrimidine/phosphomethylpyrimidine kinase
VSAQTAQRVLARTPVDERTLVAQFAGFCDVTVGAIHIGALLDASSVSTVASELARFAGAPVVCDPVIAATGGDRLADDATIAALRDDLFPRCTLVTPNLDEAALLLGRSIADLAAMECAGRDLCAHGAAAVLVKGGHLAADPTDVLVSSGRVTLLRGARIAGDLRGTGDLLACAVAARLAHGDALSAAVDAARSFVRSCIVAGVPFAGARTIP